MPAPLIAVAHRHPAIGDDCIGAVYGFEGVAGHRDASIVGLRPIDEFARWREFRRRRDAKTEVESRRGMNPAREHIVAVAAPGDRAALDRPAMFLEGQDVRHHLRRMRFPRQPIDDRHRRVPRQFPYIFVFEGADHDRIHKPR